MELDFGPAEPPSQPPSNPPPSGDSSQGEQSAPISPAPGAAPASAGPLPPHAEGGSTLPPPPPPSPAGEPPTGDSVAHTDQLPSKPAQGKGKKIFLGIGIAVILIGLGYLGYTLLLGQPSAPTETIEDLSTLPETTTLTETELPTTAPPAATPSPTGTTGAPTAGTPETVQTRDAIRKKDLATVQTYLESYFNDNRAYPISSKLAKLNDPTSPAVTALVPKYTASLPRDPKDPEFFYGYRSLEGKGYTLSARLENTADPEGKQEGSVFLYSVTK